MGRNIPLLLIKQFFAFLIRGIGFAAIMLIVTMSGVLRGIWTQSEDVAKVWIKELAFTRIDSRLESPMYWVIRLVALLMMIVCLLILSQLLTYFIERALRM